MMGILIETSKCDIEERNGALCMIFSFKEGDVNITERIFNALKERSIKLPDNNHEKYRVHSSLNAYFDKKNQEIVFEQQEANGLNNLPRLLTVDWKLLDGMEREPMSRFIDTHPLIEEEGPRFIR